MEREQLKNLLSQLRDELAQTDQLDSDLRELASDLDAQLDRLADDAQQNLADDIEENIELAAVKFEVDHPRTGAILRELADILGKMGI